MAARYEGKDAKRVGDECFADGHGVSGLDLARRLGVAAVQRHAVGTAGLGRVAARLKDAHGPKPFVYPDRIVHNGIKFWGGRNQNCCLVC